MTIGAKNTIAQQPDRIGVVIIGRNEGKRLDNCIKSVMATGVKHIVYVDSRSSDGSADLVRDYGIDVIDLNQDKPLSAARARNTGFRRLIETQSELEYVHFIDGDCELEPNWLFNAIFTFDNRADVAAICGRLREKHRSQSLYNRLCDLAWYIPAGEINSCGGIVTIRAKIFQQNNGFNETLIAGEEPEFYHRLRAAGHKILSLKENMGVHDAAMSRYSEWWKRSVRTGFSYANAREWGRWRHERRSLIIWGGIYPLLLILSPLIGPTMTVALLAIFPIQILRIYLKLNIPYSKSDKLIYASFCMFDKFPEFLGFLKYHYSRISGAKQEIIEYKD